MSSVPCAASSCVVFMLCLSLAANRCGALVLLMDAEHDREDETGGPATHEDSRQALDRCEQPPRLGQHQIAVANACVSDAGKVERRLGIGQASPPQIEQRPHRDLHQMK